MLDAWVRYAGLLEALRHYSASPHEMQVDALSRLAMSWAARRSLGFSLMSPRFDLQGLELNLQAERAKPLWGYSTVVLRDVTHLLSPEGFALSARGLSRSTRNAVEWVAPCGLKTLWHWASAGRAAPR